MQAITIAIGKTGIQFFAQELVVKELVNILSGLTPPDRTFQVPDIVYDSGSDKATNITIYLTQGKLLDFSPEFQSISQQGNGVFPMTMTAGNFSAQYNWEEKWRAWVYFPNRGGGGSWSETMWSPVDKTYSYPPAFSGLTVNVPLQFEYNNQKWSIVAGDSSGTAASSSANIPGDSIVQYQEGCFITHVSDATAAAISAIDFGSSLNSLLDGNIASIPDSGNLGGGIVYDFSLGSAGIAFPNNDGIQMGVKGGASYNGTAFSGVTPPNLPFLLPPTDGDTHHLNMYVSNYEIDALYWAFWKAGKLDVVVNPTDLQDPNILKVKTYITAEPKLKPFQAFAMQAQISPAAAPSSAFQMVWVLTGTVMGMLKQQLPSNIWNLLGGLQGNAYTTQSSFEQDLTDATIPSSYFQAIEKATQSMGMVVDSSLNFDLIIQNRSPTSPTSNSRSREPTF
jgi:hypothetical protein